MASFDDEPAFEPYAAYEALYTPPGAEIGRGASGVVRRATRRADGAAVAVKVMDLRALKIHAGSQFSVARLRREVDVLRSLRHDCIVRLYGAYGDADGVWLVMELVEGRELFDAILNRGTFTEDAARPVFAALLEAVAYMHARNVLHRDVKPENVLVCGPGEDRVKLVDFGLSKLVAGPGAGSRAHTMVGTPSYLAPEIENLKARTPSLDLEEMDEDSMAKLDLSDGATTYDDKVDSWSLGVTLYVMLVARFPVYDRDGDGKIIAAKLPPELSDAARGLLGRLLAADPAARASARDALRDPWLAGVARPPEHALALTPPASPPQKERSPEKPEAAPATDVMGLAGAHAALVASSALRLPPRLRSAGLDYHERALASRALATKLRGTALLVLEMIDDLAAALDARNADAAREVLGAVRRWTRDLETQCASAKDANLAAMRRLAEAAGGDADVASAAPKPVSTPRGVAPRGPAALPFEASATPETPATVELDADEDILELMLPVTAEDLRPPPQTVPVSSSTPERGLLECLGELHVVFTRMELFWSKVELSLDTVLKRSEALEVLLGFADTPALKGRLDARLSTFREFWRGLAEWDLDLVVPSGVSG